MHWGMGEWWNQGMGFGFHWIFMILFWGLVIWFIVWLARAASSGGSGSGGSEPSALEILKRRYARGEITKEEYERMRADLE